MKHAKVFISCGQKTSREKSIGQTIVNYFKRRRFDAYFAEEIHSVQSLTEDIYDALKDSEYFVCVLTPRRHTKTGSLFVNQELAIASFLKIPVLVYYFGSITLDGVTKYLLLNPIKVKSIIELTNDLKKRTNGWQYTSKNQLFLTFDHHRMNMPVANQPGTPLSNWWHITAHNNNQTKTAKNCYGYIISILEINSGLEILSTSDYKTELIWAGTGNIAINLPPSSKRDLDAFYSVQGNNNLIFQQRTTSTDYMYPNLKYGNYLIKYVITSDNLPHAQFEVEFTYTNAGVTIVKAQQIY